ncbi:MAG: AMIN domain-containing protein, partial [Gemmatimonadaceae bacterium]
MKRVLTAVAALAVALGAGAWRPASGSAPERGAVTSLSVVPTSGRAEVLIGIGGTVSVQNFTLSNPDRVVIDISGASLRVPTGGYDQLDRGGVLGIRYSQFSRGVVRVVVSLDAPHRYAVAQEDGRIRVTVDGTSADFSAWHVGGSAMASPAAAPAAAAPADDSVAPPAPTPLVSQAALEPIPVTVRPERRATRPRIASYGDPQQQPRITVTWENADIRDVVAAFSAYSGRTIILSKGVEATKISATITDQPWDVALRVVLNANGLDAVEDPSGILIVDTQAHILAQRAAEPLVTRSLRLNYVKAVNLKPEIQARLTRDCSQQQGANGQQQVAPVPVAGAEGQPPVVTNLNCPARGAVTADSTTNTLSVTDIAGNIEPLVEYAKQLDIRQPQVNIKAKIILVDRTSLEALGLQYDIGTANQYFNQLVTRTDSTGTPETNIADRIFLGGNTIAAIANASQDVPGAALKAVYSAAMGGFSFTSFIQALTTVSLLDVQAEPSVTTLNNHQANLTAGTQVPVRVIDASSQGGSQTAPKATVSFQQTGIILTVTPQITANHQVQMLIHAENSDVQQFSNDVGAVFPRQFIDNTMLVADGQTAIMGGLTQTSVTVSKSGIPVLMDLPIIGKLFGFTQRQEVKRDLLILITPHIVDDGQPMTGDIGGN